MGDWTDTKMIADSPQRPSILAQHDQLHQVPDLDRIDQPQRQRRGGGAATALHVHAVVGHRERAALRRATDELGATGQKLVQVRASVDREFA